MIHYNTSNVSALKASYLLKDMGVENNAFFLHLDNPKLANIDPHSLTLTELEKAMILHEIIVNPWYYYREIVRIPAGGALVPFEFHRGNIALIWASMLDISVFLVWPRQTFKTTTVSCIYNYDYHFGCEHTKSSIIAHEDAIVRKNLQGIKDIRDNMPQWLVIYDKKSDRDNEREMYIKSADNRITCRAPSRSEDGARKAGRGLTTQKQWYDEIAFIPNIGVMYDSISFAYSEASAAAKRNGTPYGQIMTTTAGFLNTPEGAWAYKFLNSCADFSEEFYDLEIDVVKEIIDNTSTSGFLNLEFMYYDLGKDEHYIDKQKKRLVNSPTPQDTLDREVFGIWKDITTDHPLGQERVLRLNKLIKPPVKYMLVNDMYTMRVYKDLSTFKTGKKLVGGLDLGGNLKGDFSVLTIVDPEDFSVVAVMRTNSQSTTLFALALITIMDKIFPNMILFPERNYNGSVIDMVATYARDGRSRVYHEKPDAPGIFNSKKIRPILFGNVLRLAIDKYGHGICDKTIIRETQGLIKTKTGRIDHKPGEHDDTLISYLLALYFLLYCKDKDKYIDPMTILTKPIYVNKYDAVAQMAMINNQVMASYDSTVDTRFNSTNSMFEHISNNVGILENVGGELGVVGDVKSIESELDDKDENILESSSEIGEIDSTIGSKFVSNFDTTVRDTFNDSESDAESERAAFAEVFGW